MIEIKLITGQFWQAKINDHVVYCSRSLHLLLDELSKMAKSNEDELKEILTKSDR